MQSISSYEDRGHEDGTKIVIGMQDISVESARIRKEAHAEFSKGKTLPEIITDQAEKLEGRVCEGCTAILFSLIIAAWMDVQKEKEVQANN